MLRSKYKTFSYKQARQYRDRVQAVAVERMLFTNPYNLQALPTDSRNFAKFLANNTAAIGQGLTAQERQTRIIVDESRRWATKPEDQRAVRNYEAAARRWIDYYRAHMGALEDVRKDPAEGYAELQRRTNAPEYEQQTLGRDVYVRGVLHNNSRFDANATAFFTAVSEPDEDPVATLALLRNTVYRAQAMARSNEEYLTTEVVPRQFMHAADADVFMATDQLQIAEMEATLRRFEQDVKDAGYDVAISHMTKKDQELVMESDLNWRQQMGEYRENAIKEILLTKLLRASEEEENRITEAENPHDRGSMQPTGNTPKVPRPLGRVRRMENIERLDVGVRQTSNQIATAHGIFNDYLDQARIQQMSTADIEVHLQNLRVVYRRALAAFTRRELIYEEMASKDNYIDDLTSKALQDRMARDRATWFAFKRLVDQVERDLMHAHTDRVAPGQMQLAWINMTSQELDRDDAGNYKLSFRSPAYDFQLTRALARLGERGSAAALAYLKQIEEFRSSTDDDAIVSGTEADLLKTIPATSAERASREDRLRRILNPDKEFKFEAPSVSVGDKAQEAADEASDEAIAVQLGGLSEFMRMWIQNKSYDEIEGSLAGDPMIDRMQKLREPYKLSSHSGSTSTGTLSAGPVPLGGDDDHLDALMAQQANELRQFRKDYEARKAEELRRRRAELDEQTKILERDEDSHTRATRRHNDRKNRKQKNRKPKGGADDPFAPIAGGSKDADAAMKASLMSDDEDSTLDQLYAKFRALAKPVENETFDDRVTRVRDQLRIDTKNEIGPVPYTEAENAELAKRLEALLLEGKDAEERMDDTISTDSGTVSDIHVPLDNDGDNEYKPLAPEYLKKNKLLRYAPGDHEGTIKESITPAQLREYRRLQELDQQAMAAILQRHFEMVDAMEKERERKPLHRTKGVRHDLGNAPVQVTDDDEIYRKTHEFETLDSMLWSQRDVGKTMQHVLRPNIHIHAGGWTRTQDLQQIRIRTDAPNHFVELDAALDDIIEQEATDPTRSLAQNASFVDYLRHAREADKSLRGTSKEQYAAMAKLIGAVNVYRDASRRLERLEINLQMQGHRIHEGRSYLDAREQMINRQEELLNEIMRLNPGWAKRQRAHHAYVQSLRRDVADGLTENTKHIKHLIDHDNQMTRDFPDRFDERPQRLVKAAERIQHYRRKVQEARRMLDQEERQRKRRVDAINQEITDLRREIETRIRPDLRKASKAMFAYYTLGKYPSEVEGEWGPVIIQAADFYQKKRKQEELEQADKRGRSVRGETKRLEGNKATPRDGKKGGHRPYQTEEGALKQRKKAEDEARRKRRAEEAARKKKEEAEATAPPLDDDDTPGSATSGASSDSTTGPPTPGPSTTRRRSPAPPDDVLADQQRARENAAQKAPADDQSRKLTPPPTYGQAQQDKKDKHDSDAIKSTSNVIKQAERGMEMTRTANAIRAKGKREHRTDAEIQAAVDRAMAALQAKYKEEDEKAAARRAGRR